MPITDHNEQLRLNHLTLITYGRYVECLEKTTAKKRGIPLSVRRYFTPDLFLNIYQVQLLYYYGEGAAVTPWMAQHDTS